MPCLVCESFGVLGDSHTMDDDCLCRPKPEKPKRGVTVNIRRHGSDPKLVYIKVSTEHGEYCVNADLISVYIDPSLPDPMYQNGTGMTRTVTVQITDK